MDNAPSSGPPLSDATSSAEYSSPQGMKAQSAPAVKTPPRAPAQGRSRNQTVRPAWLTHAGWRARTSSVRPHARTAR